MASEREMGTKLSQIKANHIARYEFAIEQFNLEDPILDAGCGCGYGSWIMAKAGYRVDGIDNSQAAITLALNSWSHPNGHYWVKDLEDLEGFTLPYNTVVCFEVLEHLSKPQLFLEYISRTPRIIVGSVPNQAIKPFSESYHLYHKRHYTPRELQRLLESTGFKITDMWAQRGGTKVIDPGVKGHTLIFKGKTCTS